MAKKLHELDPVAPNCPVEILSYLTRRHATSHDEVPVVRADLSGTIGVAVWRVETSGNVAGYTGTLVVADTILEAVSDGSAWSMGGPGFNVVAKVPGSAFPLAGKTYEVRLRFTFTGGDVCDEWFLIPTLEVDV